MICPVCHHTNIKAGSEACPKCNTPLTGDNLVLALQKSNRDQRNQKIAMTFVASAAVLLSAAFLFWVQTSDNGPSAGEMEVVVPSDSLRDLGYTLEEQTNQIEELEASLEQLESELQIMEADSSMEMEGAVESAEEMDEGDEPQASVQKSSQQKKAKRQQSTQDSHVVQKGETLWSIAQTHLGDGFLSDDLASLNSIADKDLIVVGETLRLK